MAQQQGFISAILGTVAGSLGSTVGGWISGIFGGGGGWSWSSIAAVNKQRLGGFFNILHYLKDDSSVSYWLKTITDAKGIEIDSGADMMTQVFTQTGNEAYAAGITTYPGNNSFTGKAQELFLAGEQNPVSNSGTWTPPGGSTLTGSTSTTPNTQAAPASSTSGSSFPIILIVGLAIVFVVILLVKKR